MSAQGWIALYRQLLNSDIWPHNRGLTDTEFWIMLLLRANHAKANIDWLGGRVTVERGQFISSYDHLARDTHHDKSWIRRRLAEFSKMGMTKLDNSNHRFTRITICNYDRYNTRAADNRNTNAPNDMSTDSTQTIMNNNEDNIISGKPEKIKIQRPHSRNINLRFNL
jgi:hypothetical protein